MATMTSGRVKCCGRFTLTYKREGKAYCPKCHHSFDLQTGRHLSADGCWKCYHEQERRTDGRR